MYVFFYYVVAAVILIIMYSVLTQYRYQNGRTTVTSDCIFVLAGVLLLIPMAMRISYNDTMNYAWAYHLMGHKGADPLYVFEYRFDGFLFQIVEVILVKMRASIPMFITLNAIVYMALSLWFIKKHSKNVMFSAVLFILMGLYGLGYAAMRQCLAMVLVYVAVDGFIEKKYVKSIVFLILAVMVHTSVIVMSLMYFMDHKPWTKRTYLLLVVFGVAGPMIKVATSILVMFTSAMGKNYNVAGLAGEGVNRLRFLVSIVPIILSFLERKLWKVNEDRKENILLNLSLMNGMLMWCALFGEANLFGRFANLFLFFNVISLPAILSKMENKSRRWITLITICLYTIWFLYESRGFHYPILAVYTPKEYFEHLFDFDWLPWDYMWTAG